MVKKIEDKSKTIISIVAAGDRIPFDGQVVDGCASVDESAETGYSSPVFLEAVEGRNRAIAGALVMDGWLKIESPIDARMREPEKSPAQAKHSLGKFALMAAAVITVLVIFYLCFFSPGMTT